MIKRYVVKTARALAAAGFFVLAGPALANITLPGGDSDQNGDFLLSPLSYGTSGTAYLSALLFLAGNTQQAQTQINTIPELTYDYDLSPTGLNSPALEIVYSFTNTSPTVTFTNLRFMVNVEPTGSSSSFQDMVSENWPAAKLADDPDKRQVADFSNGLKAAITFANQVSDGVNTCGGGICDADFALEWDRATLGPNESWAIRLRLVDDPSFIVPGGRYLLATSVDSAGTLLYVGNPQLVPEPETYAMLLAGLGLVAFLRMRKT